MIEINSVVAEMSSVYHLENWIDDKAYHNAKALLKVYSNVVWSLGENVDSLQQESCELADSELLNYVNCLMDIDTRVNKEHFKSKLQTVAETNCMVELINRALIKLRNYPRDGERYFEIINKSFLVKYKYSETEILEALDMSRATFYRDKKRAISLLGVILWGFIIPEIRQAIKPKNIAYSTSAIRS